GAPVLVVTLEASPANEALLAAARSFGAHAADVSVDLSVRANTNLPGDGHPSALAHRRFASRIARAIRAERLLDAARPEREPRLGSRAPVRGPARRRAGGLGR